MQLESLASNHEGGFLKLIQNFAEKDNATFIKLFGDNSWDGKAFHKFVKNCDKERMDWRPGPGKISLSHYVLRDGEEICGYGRMRFPLDGKTESEGGNLEFYVPPDKRGQGYGALTLNRMLFEAVRAGLARALVTCDSANKAAIRCIEKNRGEPIGDKVTGTSRFWIRFR